MARQNIYSSSLKTRNQIYSRDCDKRFLFYESIQVKVNTSGYYSFRSYGTVDTYGLIYKNTFNPLNPSENLFPVEVDCEANDRSRLNTHLSGDMIYVLVVTTYLFKETGAFSIVVLGNNKVILERLSKYIL